MKDKRLTLAFLGCAMLLACVRAGNAAPSTPQQGQAVWRIILPAVVRDFKGYKDQDGHPDFEHYLYDGPGNPVDKNSVRKRISKTGTRSILPMDHRNPKLENVSKYYTDVAHFDDWYNDRDPSVNRAFLIGLEFEVDRNCKLNYYNYDFFPIDKGEEFYSLNSPPLRTFDAEETFPRFRNYSFTMEFHTKFTYIQGASQQFFFSGDDDVWVFINDSLVIDLGGVHAPASQSVNLDRLRPGFLEDGEEYILDFFSAERHSTGSQIVIETSILMDVKLDPGIYVKRQRMAGKIMQCYGQKVKLPDPRPISGMAPSIRRLSPLRDFSVHRIANTLHVQIRDAGKNGQLPFVVYAANGQSVDLGNLDLHPAGGSCRYGNYAIPEKLSSGVYFLRLDGASRKQATRFAVMKQ